MPAFEWVFSPVMPLIDGAPAFIWSPAWIISIVGAYLALRNISLD